MKEGRMGLKWIFSKEMNMSIPQEAEDAKVVKDLRALQYAAGEIKRLEGAE
jgi:hypothetical protein